MADAQIEAVEEVLESLKLSDKPILMAWNKADLLTDEQCALYQEETTRYGDSILVSAETGQNIPELLSKIEEVLRRQMVKIEARIPYNHGELLNLVHEYGKSR